MHAQSRLAAAPADHAQVLAPLPASAVHLIFGALPPRWRLLCRGVCRAWRAALSDPKLWQHLEVSAAEDFPALRAAAALACGGLRTLSVCGYALTNIQGYELLLERMVLPIVRENASSLRTLRLLPDEDTFLRVHHARQLLAAVPLLETLHTDLIFELGEAAELRAALCGRPPFGPLKLRSLECFTTNETISAATYVADAELQASGDGAHDGAPEADPRAPQSLRHATPRAFLPLLARLIRGGLKQLEVYPEGDNRVDLFTDGADVEDFANACRASTMLQVLTLSGAGIFTHADGAHGVALLAALTGHPTLRRLSLEYNEVPASAAARVGAALGTLLDANSPALRLLDINVCALGDAGLSAVAAALPRNTHLRELDLSRNGLTLGFAAGALARGVCANSSLVCLVAEYGLDADENASEILACLERIVDGRYRAAAQAGL